VWLKSIIIIFHLREVNIVIARQLLHRFIVLENETHILEDRLKTLESENNFYLEVIQSVLYRINLSSVCSKECFD